MNHIYIQPAIFALKRCNQPSLAFRTMGSLPSPSIVIILSFCSFPLNTIMSQSMDDPSCTFEILSNEHSSDGGTVGQYFNYNVADVECVLGETLTSGSLHYVSYGPSDSTNPETRSVVMWDEANDAASIGDGHGRKDPKADAAEGDWSVGNRIAICYDSSCTQWKCECPTSAPTKVPSRSPSKAPSNVPTTAPTMFRTTL